MLVGFCALVLRSESLLGNTAPLTQPCGRGPSLPFDATLEFLGR